MNPSCASSCPACRGGLAAGAQGRAEIGLLGGWAVWDPGQEPSRQLRAAGRAELAAGPAQCCGVLALLLWFQKQACWCACTQPEKGNVRFFWP